MNGELEGTHSEEKDSNDSNIGGVIFFLNNLLLYYDREDEFNGTLHTVPYRIGNLAATYNLWDKFYLADLMLLALYVISVSILDQWVVVSSTPIQEYPLISGHLRQLHQLFQTGIIYNPEDGEVACRMITNLSSLVSNLPTNCRKIGCIHGPVSLTQGPIMNLRDYLRAASDEQILVFVIGEFETEMHSYIDDFVQVSDFELVATDGLIRVITAIEIKWGLV